MDDGQFTTGGEFRRADDVESGACDNHNADNVAGGEHDQTEAGPCEISKQWQFGCFQVDAEETGPPEACQTKAAPIRRPEYAAEDEFHQQTVDRVGKGIPYESVPLQIQTGRNRHTIVSEWNASENMVPKSSHETEKKVERMRIPGGSSHLPIPWPSPSGPANLRYATDINEAAASTTTIAVDRLSRISIDERSRRHQL